MSMYNGQHDDESSNDDTDSMAGEPTTRMLLYVFTLWERVTSMTQSGARALNPKTQSLKPATQMLPNVNVQWAT